MLLFFLILIGCSLIVVCVYSSSAAPRDGKVEDLDDDVQGYLPYVVAAAVAFIAVVVVAVSVFVYRFVAFLIHLLLTNFKFQTYRKLIYAIA